MAGRTVMQMILSRELGVAELGLYYLAAKLAFIPSEVSHEVINTVAFPLYANLQANMPAMARAYRAMLVAMMALILPVCVLLFALTPGLVTYVLGPNWEGTVELIRVLVLVNILGLIGETVLPILNGTGRPQLGASIECLQSSLLITLSAPLIGWFGVLGAALVWLPTVGSSQILSIVYVRRILPRPFLGAAKPAVTIAAVAIAGGLVAAAIANSLGGVAGLVVAGGTAAIVIAGLLWLADKILHLGLQANLILAFPPLGRLRFLNGEI
jgi:O-antigen/teichoic acid export membrane protein